MCDTGKGGLRHQHIGDQIADQHVGNLRASDQGGPCVGICHHGDSHTDEDRHAGEDRFILFFAIRCVHLPLVVDGIGLCHLPHPISWLYRQQALVLASSFVTGVHQWLYTCVALQRVHLLSNGGSDRARLLSSTLPDQAAAPCSVF